MLQKLQIRLGNIYNIDNVIISGTHTHGTPGGFQMYLLYDMTTFGFVPETYRALALGIYKVRNVKICLLVDHLVKYSMFLQSIVRAHDNLQEGRVYMQETEILDASVNRSPTSYMNNPEEERAQ